MKIKISLIITVLNEAQNIRELLLSIVDQTLLPDEVVIVDGGSTDQTLELMQRCVSRHPQLKMRILRRAGNRSVGRNYALKHASHDWLALTDAGCVLDKNWLAELVQALQVKHSSDHLPTDTVVAGYYQGLPQTKFEQAVVPYVLVMPDRVKPDKFLPSSRSMLIHRSTFDRLGGFNENLEVSEDYELAQRLKNDAQVRLVFTPKAVVHWRPKSNLSQFTKMVFQMARDDARAGVIRKKVWLIFARYLIFAGLIVGRFVFQVQLGLSLSGALLAIYGGWAVAKNYRYAAQAWYWLPVLQLGSDLAVMAGTGVGLSLKK